MKKKFFDNDRDFTINGGDSTETKDTINAVPLIGDMDRSAARTFNRPLLSLYENQEDSYRVLQRVAEIAVGEHKTSIIPGVLEEFSPNNVAISDDGKYLRMPTGCFVINNGGDYDVQPKDYNAKIVVNSPKVEYYERKIADILGFDLMTQDNSIWITYDVDSNSKKLNYKVAVGSYTFTRTINGTDGSPVTFSSPELKNVFEVTKWFKENSGIGGLYVSSDSEYSLETVFYKDSGENGTVVFKGDDNNTTFKSATRIEIVYDIKEEKYCLYYTNKDELEINENKHIKLLKYTRPPEGSTSNGWTREIPLFKKDMPIFSGLSIGRRDKVSTADGGYEQINDPQCAFQSKANGSDSFTNTLNGNITINGSDSVKILKTIQIGTQKNIELTDTNNNTISKLKITANNDKTPFYINDKKIIDVMTKSPVTIISNNTQAQGQSAGS